jgi:hypothetical protein
VPLNINIIFYFLLGISETALSGLFLSGTDAEADGSGLCCECGVRRECGVRGESPTPAELNWPRVPNALFFFCAREVGVMKKSMVAIHLKHIGPIYVRSKLNSI